MMIITHHRAFLLQQFASISKFSLISKILFAFSRNLRYNSFRGKAVMIKNYINTYIRSRFYEWQQKSCDILSKIQIHGQGRKYRKPNWIMQTKYSLILSWFIRRWYSYLVVLVSIGASDLAAGLSAIAVSGLFYTGLYLKRGTKTPLWTIERIIS